MCGRRVVGGCDGLYWCWCVLAVDFGDVACMVRGAGWVFGGVHLVAWVEGYECGEGFWWVWVVGVARCGLFWWWGVGAFFFLLLLLGMGVFLFLFGWGWVSEFRVRPAVVFSFLIN